MIKALSACAVAALIPRALPVSPGCSPAAAARTMMFRPEYRQRGHASHRHIRGTGQDPESNIHTEMTEAASVGGPHARRMAGGLMRAHCYRPSRLLRTGTRGARGPARRGNWTFAGEALPLVSTRLRTSRRASSQKLVPCTGDLHRSHAAL